LDTIDELLRGLEKHEVFKESEKKKVLKLQDEWKNLLRMHTAVEKDI
jgi:dynein heavy chain